jgi:hypothetical protein
MKTKAEVEQKLRELREEGVELNRDLQKRHRAIQSAIHEKNIMTARVSANQLLQNQLEELLKEDKDNYELLIQKETIVKERYYENQEHFSQRLLERYNISITPDEYKELTDKDLKTVFYKVSGNMTFGELQIQGQNVWVIRNKRVKSLVTALHVNDDIRPVPQTLRYKNVSISEFNKKLKEAEEQVEQVADWLATNNDDKPRLFKENPLNLPLFILSKGCSWWYKRYPYDEAFINGIFNK